jgi:hypothetical protein
MGRKEREEILSLQSLQRLRLKKVFKEIVQQELKTLEQLSVQSCQTL